MTSTPVTLCPAKSNGRTCTLPEGHGRHAFSVDHLSGGCPALGPVVPPAGPAETRDVLASGSHFQRLPPVHQVCMSKAGHGFHVWAEPAGPLIHNVSASVPMGAPMPDIRVGTAPLPGEFVPATTTLPPATPGPTHPTGMGVPSPSGDQVPAQVPGPRPLTMAEHKAVARAPAQFPATALPPTTAANPAGAPPLPKS